MKQSNKTLLQNPSNLMCDCIEKEVCTFTEHGKIVTRCINCGGRVDKFI